MMRKVFCFLLCWLGASAVAAQGAYRWVDETGKVHYGDRPPSSAREVKSLRHGAPSPVEKPLPYATRQAMANFPVTLYVSPDCGEGCQQAADFLKRRGVPFAQKSVEQEEELAALKALAGGEAFVPVLTVGPRVKKGFEAGEWERLLDAAGYPKAP
ncbi:MAG: glutaredoxin family protein [Rhodocyclaceae bacterium]|nr:glutaredoxin family protein [Rhodocyclaceae bacterium]